MSNYSQNVFFGPKDSLTTGDPNKVIKGSELDAELQEISDAIATKTETGSIPSGTKMLFVETVAPSGWTLNTAYDDRTILISDGPVNDGTPDTGGNWTLSGMSLDQGGGHSHGDTFSITLNKLAAAAAGAAVNVVNTATLGGGVSSVGTHTHGLTNSSWRPAYVEVIVCSKD